MEETSAINCFVYKQIKYLESNEPEAYHLSLCTNLQLHFDDRTYIIYSLISFPLTDTILPLRSVTVRALARVVTRCVVAVRETVALVDLVKTFI